MKFKCHTSLLKDYNETSVGKYYYEIGEIQYITDLDMEFQWWLDDDVLDYWLEYETDQIKDLHPGRYHLYFDVEYIDHGIVQYYEYNEHEYDFIIDCYAIKTIEIWEVEDE